MQRQVGWHRGKVAQAGCTQTAGTECGALRAHFRPSGKADPNLALKQATDASLEATLGPIFACMRARHVHSMHASILCSLSRRCVLEPGPIFSGHFSVERGLCPFHQTTPSKLLIWHGVCVLVTACTAFILKDPALPQGVSLRPSRS